MNKLIIKANDANKTILKYLEKMLHDVPKSRIEKAFRNKDIRLNGKRINDKSIILKENDQIVVYGINFTLKKVKYIPVQKDFEIIYEDKNIIVVDKHAGYSMHDDKNSLDNQIFHYLKFKQTDSFVPSSIGRLDKVTSGIVVYAKNYDTLRQMKDENANLKKVYQFRSDLPQETTTNYKIEHDEENQREVCGKEGKPTKTIFYFEGNKKYAELITGRKHQIRASLSKLGYPIYGDRKYGGKKMDRVYLHSFYLKINGLSQKLDYLNGMEFISRPKWK